MIVALTEILTLLFAIASAWHDVAPVGLMRRYGVERKVERQFHRSGFVQRGLCIVAVSISASGLSFCGLFLAVLLAFVFYAAFDIVLNLLTGFKAFYVGRTAWGDKKLRSWFNGGAGVVKFVFCLVAIALLNWLVLR